MSNNLSDWLFHATPSADPEDQALGVLSWVVFVQKDFWAQNKHLDDHHIRKFLPLPRKGTGLSEAMESIFECTLTASDITDYLLGLGFAQDPEFSRFSLQHPTDY